FCFSCGVSWRCVFGGRFGLIARASSFVRFGVLGRLSDPFAWGGRLPLLRGAGLCGCAAGGFGGRFCPPFPCGRWAAKFAIASTAQRLSAASHFPSWSPLFIVRVLPLCPFFTS